MAWCPFSCTRRFKPDLPFNRIVELAQFWQDFPRCLQQQIRRRCIPFRGTEALEDLARRRIGIQEFPLEAHAKYTDIESIEQRL
jgi:hypothetical protein